MTEPIPLDAQSPVLRDGDVTLVYDVTGPNTANPYGSTDIVPYSASVHLRYTPEHGVTLQSVLVHGHRAKKDGTPGLLTSSAEFFQTYAASIESTPAWVRAVGEAAADQLTRWTDRVGPETSDGHHTFAELYRYRMLYNAALFNEWRKWGVYDVHKSTRHHDGEECFGGGWFIVVAQLPTGQISNHYPIADWYRFRIPERPLAAVWDGHTPEVAAARLEAFIATTPEETAP